MDATVCLIAWTLLWGGIPGGGGPGISSGPPSILPIQARLVVERDVYVLDPAHRGEAFRQKLAQPPQPVQMNGGQRIVIRAVPQVVPQAPRPKEADQKKDEQAEAVEAGDAEGDQEAPDAKRGQDAGREAPDPDAKAPEENKPQNKAAQVQVFQIQGNQQGIQIQARIQVQGNIGGIQGAPQVQVVVLGQDRPAPPSVNMALELRNVTSQPLTITLGGAKSRLDLKLEGPGAASTTDEGHVAVRAVPVAEEVKIEPGQTHRIPIRRLSHGPNNRAGCYWTEPGEYKLTAIYTVPVESALSSASAPIRIETPPVKVRVVEKGSHTD